MAMEKCSQCDKPAIGRFIDGQTPLCVDHYFTLVKAGYLQATMAAAQLNFTEQQLWVSTGGLLPLKQINLPPPNFLEGAPTFNTIKISNSTVGMLNTGTIANLKDVEFTVELMQSQGQTELAKALAELTQQVFESADIAKETKEEVSQLLKFIATQINTKPESRQVGPIKAILSGLRTNIATVAALLTILDKVEPVIRSYFGI